MSSEKCEILHQVRSLLMYHKSSGLDEYRKCADVDDFLGTRCFPENTKIQIVTKDSVEPVSTISSKSHPVVLSDTIEEINDEVKTCQNCGLCRDRVAPVSGTGGHDASFLLVGGWLTASSPDEINDSSVFGYDEDEMLLRMLNAIHFPREATFITNVIKCGIKASVQPKRENVDACVSYLHRQIAATIPDVICTMGLIATRALLQNSKPLSQLRGRFHDYKIDKQKTIVIMPTYHPTFLLKNPEMKMATWNDLQLIEKRLNAKGL